MSGFDYRALHEVGFAAPSSSAKLALKGLGSVLLAVGAGWLGSRFFFSTGHGRHVDFMPKGTMESVLLRPGVPVALGFPFLAQTSQGCIFAYGAQAEAALAPGARSSEEAWMYGLQQQQEKAGLARPTGFAGHVTKGRVFCFSSNELEKKVKEADQLYELSRSDVERAVGAVVRQDGSSMQAIFYYQLGVIPAIIIGPGRIGKALAAMGVPGDLVLGRADAIPANRPGPIYVATRNDQLANVIERTPASRREDLVFLQNGMLQPFLDQLGLGDNTQALIYFAVAKMGDTPTDGMTRVNPEGLTAATGKWAPALAARLAAGNLKCHVLDKADFQLSMYEKLVWISAFMLVGANHPGSTVGDVATSHKSEVEKLITELLDGISDLEGISFKPGAVDRLIAYAESVAHFPTAVKEFEWRNGYFYSISKASRPDPFPYHTELLKKVGAV